MSISSARCLATVALLLAVGSASAAPTWQANITDTYQHQRWGAPAGSGVPGAVDAAPANITWQATWNAGTGKASFGGWCYPAAMNNVLHRYNKLGYATYGANNADSVTKLHNELNTLQGDFFGNAAPSNVGRWASILNTRGAGTAKGISVPGLKGGLVAGQFQQVGADLLYWSSDGRERKIETTNVFGEIPGVFDRGDSGVLYLKPKPGDAGSALNWWDYHGVTVAGYDKAVGSETIYFADPDSNKGNADANGGWTGLRAGGFADWKKAPAAVGAKARRFVEAGVGADGVPVPAGAAPTGAEQASLYFTGTLADNKTSFKDTTGRYSGAQITGLHTIEPMRGANKPGGGPGAGTVKTFSVTPDTSEDFGMSEFYLFPKAGEDISNVSMLSLPGWSFSSYLGADPLDSTGDTRIGWHFTADSIADALAGNDILEFDYDTSDPMADPLSGWDLVFNWFPRDAMSGAMLADPTLWVQVVGAELGYEPLGLQVPAPSALTLLMLGGLACTRRQRRTQ